MKFLVIWTCFVVCLLVEAIGLALLVQIKSGDIYLPEAISRCIVYMVFAFPGCLLGIIYFGREYEKFDKKEGGDIF